MMRSSPALFKKRKEKTGCGKSKLSLGIQKSVAVKNLKYQYNHTKYLI